MILCAFLVDMFPHLRTEAHEGTLVVGAKNMADVSEATSKLNTDVEEREGSSGEDENTNDNCGKNEEAVKTFQDLVSLPQAN